MDVDTNVKATESVEPKNSVKTSDVSRLARSAELEPLAFAPRIIVLYANVQKDILAVPTQNVDRNVMEMLIALQVDRPVSTESVKILATERAVLGLIVIYEV